MELTDSVKIKTIEDLLDQTKHSYTEDEVSLIRSAFAFTEAHISDKDRKSGQSLHEHYLTVAAYVSIILQDANSVCAAILHDILSDTDVTLDLLDEKFGTEIAFLVDGISKIKNLSKSFSDSQSSDEFTYLIFNTSDDLRIIILRLADKLHNIQTIDALPADIKKMAATKIMNIYAPLAEYIGLGYVQRLLQDKAFSILEPDNFDKIATFIKKVTEGETGVIESFTNEIHELTKSLNLAKAVEISSREKGVYSSFKKIKRKYSKADGSIDEHSLAELKDVYAFRIITENLEDCYLVLGMLHANYTYSDSDFKDYISAPKENGYRSIHTVLEYENQYIEVQIRTKEMHEYNEYGPASHVAYKRGDNSHQGDSVTWTKDLAEWKEGDRESFKIKLFQNSIFVFTPKGLVIRLAKGACPLDFAFRIHTEIGSRYRGALVNGKMVKMDYKLETGDTVEILTNKEVNIRRDWLNFVTSTKAKSKIKRILLERRKLDD